MATNVTGATGYVGPRSLCATSTGRLWQLTGNGTTLQMWYSDDQGGTWTRNTAADITGVYVQSASLFIDQDDHAHVSYVTSGINAIYYHRMASIGVATAWSGSYTVHGGASFADSHVVAHREGTGWKAHVLYQLTQAGPLFSIEHCPITITSGGVVTVGAFVNVTSYLATDVRSAALDFHHTQSDITAVQGGTPHLYAVWYDGALGRAHFSKATYSGGVWTWGTVRTISGGLAFGAASSIDMIFDGTRVVIAAYTSGVTPTVTLYERDAADTATTTRTLPATTIARPRVTYNHATQDVYLVGENVAGNSVDYKQYTRATDTWGAQTAIEAEAVTNNTVTVRRGGLFVVDAVWDAASSLRFERTTIPSPPTAPTWVNSNGAADVGASLVLDWVPQDPLPGDTQGAFAMKRQIGAGTPAYYRASDQTWQAAEVKNTTAVSLVTLAAGWGDDSDANHKFTVKTWDAADSEGVYGPELTVTPSVPSVPTIVTPANGVTFGAAALTGVWTVASQSQYKFELLSTGGVVLWSSGIAPSSVDRTCVVGYALVNTIPYQVRLTTWNSEGLASVVTSDFPCAYTAPLAPTVTVTADSTLGKITVAHTNPTPVIPVVLVSGGHTLLTSGGDTVVTAAETPTVTTVDIFVRCATGTYPAGERPVGGAGIRVATGIVPDATWIDWAAPSGRAQEYLVRAWSANGTYTDSAWTA